MSWKNTVTTTMEAIRKSVAEQLQAAPAWAVLSHEKPDGDTLGCASALIGLAKRLGKKCLWLGVSPYPHQYAFLPHAEDYVDLSTAQVLEEWARETFLFVAVDTSNPERGPLATPEFKRCFSPSALINIDHHADNTRYGTTNLVDTDASASAEALCDLFDVGGWSISRDEARALYVALITDNGRFSFSSTTPRSFRCALRLLEAGVEPWEIADHLNKNFNPGTLPLWGRGLTRMELFADGACALVWLAEDDFAQTRTTHGDTENFVNWIMRIRGVQIGALCVEASPDVRVSLRTSRPLNARELAAQFGGGGHDQAAGCKIRACLPEAVGALKRAMASYAERFSRPR